MDINVIIQAIGSVGFPIVACCAMFYMYNKIMTELTTTLIKIDTTLELFIRKFETEGVNNE